MQAFYGGVSHWYSWLWRRCHSGRATPGSTSGWHLLLNGTLLQTCPICSVWAARHSPPALHPIPCSRQAGSLAAVAEIHLFKRYLLSTYLAPWNSFQARQIINKIYQMYRMLDGDNKLERKHRKGMGNVIGRVLFVVQLLNQVQVFATLRTVAHQASLSTGILQARILEWVAMPSSSWVFTILQTFKPSL